MSDGNADRQPLRIVTASRLRGTRELRRGNEVLARTSKATWRGRRRVIAGEREYELRSHRGGVEATGPLGERVARLELGWRGRGSLETADGRAWDARMSGGGISVTGPAGEEVLVLDRRRHWLGSSFDVRAAPALADGDLALLPLLLADALARRAQSDAAVAASASSG